MITNDMWEDEVKNVREANDETLKEYEKQIDATIMDNIPEIMEGEITLDIDIKKCYLDVLKIRYDIEGFNITYNQSNGRDPAWLTISRLLNS